MNVNTDKTEIEVAEKTVAEPHEAQAAPDQSSERPKSMRETILAAVQETKRKKETPPDPQKSTGQPKEEKASAGAEAADGKKPPEEKTAEVESGVETDRPNKADQDKTESKQTEKQGDDTEKSQTSNPPAAWSRSSKTLWATLPPSIQDEVLRREENAAKGVAELKERHKTEVETLRARTTGLEAEVAPYDEAIRQAGRTREQVVRQLFQWHMALSGPNKAHAFRQLAQNFGVDITQLAGGNSGAGGQEGSTGAGSPAAPDVSWAPAVGELQRRLEQYEAMTAASHQASAEKAVLTWAKDKPHFEKVRQRMAQLINADADLLRMGQPAANGFIKDGDIDMDAAYEAAVWADAELRADLIRGQQEERDVAAKAAAERARGEAEARLRAEKAQIEAERAKRAATSIKPGAPLSGLNGSTSTKQLPSRQESVRDSIRRALQGAQ